MTERHETIVFCAGAAARRHGVTYLAEPAACYLLRMDARLSFERIVSEYGIQSRWHVLKNFNRISVGLRECNEKIVAVIRTARNMIDPGES